MKRNMKKRMRRSGFTLLEVLLVVGILAMLAAFVVPNLLGAGEEARLGLAKAAVGRNGAFASALKKYRLDVGTYPETDDGLGALYEKPGSIDDDEENPIWKGPYVDTPPEEMRDPWGQEFQYRSPGEFNETGYDLWSTGPDRQDGTDDDVKNWVER